MRKIFLIYLISKSTLLCAQPDIKVSSEKTDNGVAVYADNREYCPVSLEVEWKLENLELVGSRTKIYVVPPRESKFKLAELKVVKPGKAYRHSFSSRTMLGDALAQELDSTFQYDLPFKKGSSFMISQGYNGQLSHKGENALDFNMPEGTEVLAARDGTVVKVVQENNESCPREECKKFNNYVLVCHANGTMAEYTHIKFNGARVKAGDKISKGDLIALSGNTGWSSAPHLHFFCFIQGIDNRKTLVTKFRTGDGKRSEVLKEKKTYSRQY